MIDFLIGESVLSALRQLFFLGGINIIKQLLINDQITANQVRLVGQDGEQLGVVSTRDAISKAHAFGLDLVLISPSSIPVVCKIMDYGKYKFEQAKKEKEMKKNQKVVEFKEIQLSMTIDKHDIETKARHANKFLTDGNKVKVVLRMKGRQQAYSQNGVELVKKFFEMLSENGAIDKEPEIAGRNIILIVSPKK